METRLTELEVKVAFQDDLRETLNRTVANQQQEISLMQQEIRVLYQQIKAIQPSLVVPFHEEAPPPHY